MYAVIRTGGKQYRVAENDQIVVERLAGEPGEMLEIEDVLMIADGEAPPVVGTPVIEKAAVFAEVVEQTRSGKILVFKKKRRKNYRRTKGHRQDQTVLRITGISATGEKPKAKAKAKPKPKAEKAPEPAPEPEAEPKAVEQAAPATEAPAEPTTEAAPAEPAAETAPAEDSSAEDKIKE